MCRSYPKELIDVRRITDATNEFLMYIDISITELEAIHRKLELVPEKPEATTLKTISKKSILIEDLMKNSLRASIKHLPFLGSFLYDVIYGTIDSQKYGEQVREQLETSERRQISKVGKITNAKKAYTEKWYQNRTIQGALIGACVLLLVSIGSWMISLHINKSKSNQDQPELVITEGKLPLSLKEICQDIDNRPLLQREQTAKSYVGIPVKREYLSLFEIIPEEENFQILMVFPG